MPNDPSTEDLEALRAFDTPTICNALEPLVPERHGFGYTSKPLVCPRPELPPIVGYARTATIRALHPTERDAEAALEARLAYYRHMAETPHPTITVIQDLDPSPGYGAWWGEVHTNVHKGLGSQGVITDGSIRDIDVCAEGFQMLAGSIGPSHAFVHCVDWAITVTVAGMVVRPGDIVHADRHGAVVVPPEMVREIPATVERQAAAEAVLIGASQKPGFKYEILADILGGGGGDH